MTQSFFLTNVVTHFQLLSVTIIDFGLNANKHDISWIKLFWGKNGYKTHVADVDKGH